MVVMSRKIQIKSLTFLILVASFVGCSQQSSSPSVNADESIQANQTLPPGTFYYPLAQAVRDWTMPDEVPYLVDEFLKM